MKTNKKLLQDSENSIMTWFEYYHTTSILSLSAISPSDTLQSLSNDFVTKTNIHFHLYLLGVDVSDFGHTCKKNRAIFDPVDSGLSLPPP